MNMQEREKKKIVLASVLKPVNEIRMFSKIATSLAKASYDVSIIGYQPTGAFPKTPIHLYPIGIFHRLSIKRVFAPFHIFKHWLALKPDILIVSTHELLFWGVLTRLFLRTRVIYDVQENYYLNILHTSAFPAARPLHSFLVARQRSACLHRRHRERRSSVHRGPHRRESPGRYGRNGHD